MRREDLGTSSLTASGSITTGDQGSAVVEPLFIQIRRKRYQVASLQQASEMYCTARDASGYGASRIPEAQIVTATGRPVARVSYNGRVWPAAKWSVDQRPLYDNRVAS